MANVLLSLAAGVMASPINKTGLMAAMIAGFLASLALPPHGITVFVLALSLPGLQLAFAQDWRQGFLIGWATGFGWFVYSLHWISHSLLISGGGDLVFLPFSALGLPAFLALFWGAGFAIALVFSSGRISKNYACRLVLLIAFLSLTEYARGFVLTGFPWNWPGMVLANADITLAMASVIGASGGTVIILALAMMPALLIVDARRLVLGLMVVIAGLLAWSGQHLYQDRDADPLMQVRMVQPNIAQQDKWDRQLRPQHLAAMMAGSRQPRDRPLDLIIWPETAFAGFYERDRGVVNAIALAASSGATPVLLGMLSEPEFNIFYNSVGIYTPGKGMGVLYHKRHLVPFGEYAPMRSYIPYIDTIAGPYDFSAGQNSNPLVLDKHDGTSISILPLICYEVIFPAKTQQTQQTVNADVMVNLTNDAWFGDSIGPRQHLAMARFRSAELGMAMIRVANTGISAVIDPFGRVSAKIDYGISGIQDSAINKKIPTIYAQYGDWSFAALIGLLIFIARMMTFLTANKPKL